MVIMIIIVLKILSSTDYDTNKCRKDTNSNKQYTFISQSQRLWLITQIEVLIMNVIRELTSRVEVNSFVRPLNSIIA